MQPVVRLNANEMLKRFNERDLSGSMNPMSIERPKQKENGSRMKEQEEFR